MGKREINTVIRILTICCAVLFLSSFAPNESWGAEKKFPNRTINVVIVFAPGASDVVLRPHLEKISGYLGQPLNIVYKPGAAGTVGSSFVRNATPDGYTLLGSSPGPILIGPVTKEDLDYTLDSFEPICRLVMSPNFMVVKADSPLKTLADVIAAAKASPGKLSFSTSGVFGTNHFSMEMFQKSAGIKLTHVPCPGSTPAMTALLGGHVDLCASDIGPLKPQVEAGSVRLITVMDERRSQLYPNTPTFLEFGHRVILPSWYGLMAPKGTPKEVINTIYVAAKKANELDKDYLEKQAKNIGSEVLFLNPDEFDKASRAQLKTIKDIFKDMKDK
jgi:tripartite-type tricarboxylate transporter receptor subunit TctC